MAQINADRMNCHLHDEGLLKRKVTRDRTTVLRFINIAYPRRSVLLGEEKAAKGSTDSGRKG